MDISVREGLEKNFGKKKAKKIMDDEIAEENGKWYDMSLWRAMYHSVKGEFWKATIIEGAGCELLSFHCDQV